ncbi:hypothetical protein, partial [Clostridium tyrobutyricum]|uniref:hypothetical protein n=1 Tax=Clostridium tyrobutyricum TaxID=1519 RepID=UPI00241EBF51
SLDIIFLEFIKKSGKFLICLYWKPTIINDIKIIKVENIPIKINILFNTNGLLSIIPAML